MIVRTSGMHRGRSLPEWQQDVFKCAYEHGFYHNDDGSPIDVKHPLMLSSRLALIHSEISEAYDAKLDGQIELFEKDGKPEGMIVELADAAIRCLDFAGSLDLNLWQVIEGAEGDYKLPRGFSSSEVLTINLEVSRALEAVRDGHIGDGHAESLTPYEGSLRYHLAGIIMQCGLCALYHGGDLWEAIHKKHEYNLKRPFKHGRKSL